MTGVYTGRSPKDKYIVMDARSKDTVWWNTPDYPNDIRMSALAPFSVICLRRMELMRVASKIYQR